MLECTLERLQAQALSVPTVDPFIIASGEVRATRSVLIRATVRRADGRSSTGLGEAACLPPVTREDQPDALAAVQAARANLEQRRFGSLQQLEEVLDSALDGYPVARSGVEVALLDALARIDEQPLWHWLGGPTAAPTIETDVTLPILSAARMAELAQQWWAQGFRKLKVKAGRSLEADVERLTAIAQAVPAAIFQPDANAGLTVDQALAYLDAAANLKLTVSCFEQPCATMAELAALSQRTNVPVIADESVKSLSDLDTLLRQKAAAGVNLKIAKSGGLLAARRIGARAKEAGLKLMVGGMMETRLGMTAATHLAASLGGVEFADLDTAWLLASDPFIGGYQAQGPRYTLPLTPGLGVSETT